MIYRGAQLNESQFALSYINKSVKNIYCVRDIDIVDLKISDYLVTTNRLINAHTYVSQLQVDPNQPHDRCACTYQCHNMNYIRRTVSTLMPLSARSIIIDVCACCPTAPSTTTCSLASVLCRSMTVKRLT